MLFFYVIADLILIITILLFCKVLLRLRERANERSLAKLLTAGASMVVASVCTNLAYNPIVKFMLYTVALCVLLWLFFEEKVSTIVVSGIWMIVIMAMLDTMSIVLFEMISNIVGDINGDVERVLRSIILFIYVFVIGNMYNKKYHQGIQSMGIASLIGFSVLSFVDTFIVMVIARITINEEQRQYKEVFFVAFILVILGLFLQLGAVILILMQRNIYKESQQLTAMYLDDQTKHYEYLENRETETKKFRHDLRDHMDMLVSFAREHKYDEFNDYVEKIHTKVDKLGNAVSVQNSVVDAILNRYYSEAKNNDVKMEVEGKFPVDCKIENYDICTIFSNLLRNALEATMKAEEKWISVGCRYTDKVIVVEIANSFDNKAGNGKSKAHKADKNNHGFGLINVEESIEKYNGVWYRDQEDNVYKVTISFIYARMEEKDEDSNN